MSSPQVDQWQTDTGLPGRGKARTREGALWCSGQPTLEGGKRVSCNRTVTESIPRRDSSQYGALPVGRMLVPARFAHQGQRISLTSPGLAALNVHCVFRDLELVVNNLIKKRPSLWCHRRSANGSQSRSWNSAVTEIMPLVPWAQRSARCCTISSLSHSSLTVVSHIAQQYSIVERTREYTQAREACKGTPQIATEKCQALVGFRYGLRDMGLPLRWAGPIIVWKSDTKVLGLRNTCDDFATQCVKASWKNTFAWQMHYVTFWDIELNTRQMVIILLLCYNRFHDIWCIGPLKHAFVCNWLVILCWMLKKKCMQKKKRKIYLYHSCAPMSCIFHETALENPMHCILGIFIF